jgi:cytochrome b pre-mRNA-processing protein 3
MGIAELFGLRPAGERRAARALYEGVVLQARQPGLFASLHVPDDLDGRFESLALHVFLVALRLKSETTDAAAGLSRALLEAFVEDMDRSLREMGAADLGVARRVKAMAEALFGRIKVYGSALDDNGDADLEAALRRNLYGTLETPLAEDIAAAARYMRRQHEALAAQPLGQLLAGHVDFVLFEDAVGRDAAS